MAFHSCADCVVHLCSFVLTWANIQACYPVNVSLYRPAVIARTLIQCLDGPFATTTTIAPAQISQSFGYSFFFYIGIVMSVLVLSCIVGCLWLHYCRGRETIVPQCFRNRWQVGTGRRRRSPYEIPCSVVVPPMSTPPPRPPQPSRLLPNNPFSPNYQPSVPTQFNTSENAGPSHVSTQTTLRPINPFIPTGTHFELCSADSSPSNSPATLANESDHESTYESPSGSIDLNDPDFVSPTQPSSQRSPYFTRSKAK